MKYRKLSSGNYTRQIMVNGERISITARTITECKEKEYKIRSQTQEKGSRIDFNDAVEQLLASKDKVLSANTMKGYKTICKYIEPLYDKDCSSITSLDLQKFINEFSETHSPHTCSNTLSFILTVLKSVNPEKHYSVKLPQKKKREVKFPSEEEVRLMMDNAEPKLRNAIMLAAFVPARRGEVSALKYKDIKKDTIHIHATITQDEKYEYKDTPKSSAGDRYVLLPHTMIRSLGKGDPEEYVIGYTPESLYMKYRRLLKKLGLPSYRFHDLRVFGASWLHKMGYPNSAIMQRGGWDTESTLVEVYRKNLTDEESIVKDIGAFFC